MNKTSNPCQTVRPMQPRYLERISSGHLNNQVNTPADHKCIMQETIRSGFLVAYSFNIRRLKSQRCDISQGTRCLPLLLPPPLHHVATRSCHSRRSVAQLTGARGAVHRLPSRDLQPQSRRAQRRRSLHRVPGGRLGDPQSPSAAAAAAARRHSHGSPIRGRGEGWVGGTRVWEGLTSYGEELRLVERNSGVGRG